MTTTNINRHENKDARNIRARWLSDPVNFVTAKLGAKPWTKQREILEAIRNHDRTAVRSCNASGKTYTAALATIWWLMCHREATVITTAPTNRQVKQLLWKQIREIHAQNSQLIGGKTTAASLEIDSRRTAFGYSTDTQERFQGFHRPNCMFIVDEASGVPEDIFAAIEGSMTSYNPKMLMIGNPTKSSGYFFNAFHRSRDEWNQVHISAFDTPNMQITDPEQTIQGLLTPQWVESMRRNYGEESPEYNIRVLGNFPDQDRNTLIPLQTIEDAVAKPAMHADEKEYIVMGVDVARYGTDRTVAIIRKGPNVIHIAALPKSDTMKTTGAIIDIAREYEVHDINIDEAGLGAAVFDRIMEVSRRQFAIFGINASRKPRNRNMHANFRAQMYDELKDRFMRGDISIPDDPELIRELAMIRYEFNSAGQMQVADKTDIRNPWSKSPDKADALAIAYAHTSPPFLVR